MAACSEFISVSYEDGWALTHLLLPFIIRFYVIPSTLHVVLLAYAFETFEHIVFYCIRDNSSFEEATNAIVIDPLLALIGATVAASLSKHITVIHGIRMRLALIVIICIPSGLFWIGGTDNDKHIISKYATFSASLAIVCACLGHHINSDIAQTYTGIAYIIASGLSCLFSHVLGLNSYYAIFAISIIIIIIVRI